MSDIIGAEACAAELKRLLKQIKEAIQAIAGGSPDQLTATIDTETEKLVDFTNRTEPSNYGDAQEVAAIRKIDDQATEAISEIYGDSARAIIGRMTQRAAKLNQVTKEVRQLAAENESKAKAIRLVPVRNAIDGLTGVVTAVREATDALSEDEPDEATVKSKLESVLRAISNLTKAAGELENA